MADLSAADILAMCPGEASRLFPGDAAGIAARFRDLARAWHPDRSPDPQAAQVFARLAELRRHALVPFAAPQERRFETRDGRTFRFRWHSRHLGESGEVLVADRHIAHLVPAEADDLASAAAKIDLPFAGHAMRREIEPLLPRTTARLETATGTVFVEAKRPDQLLLADLLRLGPVDPRHAAWMTTRLLNLACWLDWAGLAHGAIGPDCLLVSPERHEVALTGPMLCAARFGTPFSSLPERTLALLPRVEAEGRADAAIDPELVRLTIREALGDPAGTRLAADPAFPPPFARWLLMPSAGGAQADFPAWEQARDAAFGPRRFVRWDIDPAALRAA